MLDPMHLITLKMLKKRLGIEAIEKIWNIRADSIYDYYKIPTTLIIPESAKDIGDSAFRYCDEIKKVIIPESVEMIGYCAFYGCRGATIILRKHKKDFKYVGSCAFDYCRDVKEKVRD